MDTSKPAIFVNGALLPMHVRKRVRTVIQVVGADRGAIVGKSPDDLQLVVKGSPPSAPLSNFVEVIGIADSEKSIQAEIWTNFGEVFEYVLESIHIPTTSCVSLQMGNISTYSSELKEFSLRHGFDRPTYVILEHFLVS
ncbi:hypothetical protein DKX38_010309 [Salix brachista]|uniref:Replication protein A 14 kDa subunit B n=1 Tax=Salix brachista TaxID=2182728 RepID=A0A5N5MD61_9ROSI|nr:hypothetical protein DKX38_010309 [Salix brachista]